MPAFKLLTVAVVAELSHKYDIAPGIETVAEPSELPLQFAGELLVIDATPPDKLLIVVLLINVQLFASVIVTL